MSRAARSQTRSLDALHGREALRLEGLRVELADAVRQCEARGRALHEVEAEHRGALSAARPGEAARIDPALAAARLLQLGAIGHRIAAARADGEQATTRRDRLFAESLGQSARLDAIGIRRAAAAQAERSSSERRRAAAADDLWLAASRRRTTAQRGGGDA